MTLAHVVKFLPETTNTHIISNWKLQQFFSKELCLVGENHLTNIVFNSRINKTTHSTSEMNDQILRSQLSGVYYHFFYYSGKFWHLIKKTEIN